MNEKPEKETMSQVTMAEPTNGVLTVASLQWKPIEAPDTAPELACDECHQKKPANGQLSAEVPIRPGTNLTIVICCDRCLYLFKRRKNIDGILRATVNSIRKKMRMAAIKAQSHGNRS